MNDNPFFREWHNVTTLHPLGLAAVIVLGFTMLLLPRRYAVLPMIVMACFIASTQRVVIFELDFTLMRLMVLFGWARMLFRKEFRGFEWKPIDVVFVVWAFSGAASYILLHGTVSALVLKAGNMYDALGMYFMFRFLIRSWADVERLAIGIVVISIPVAIWFLIEKITGRNAFSVFGGVSEITAVRFGKVRAQGAFGHPIFAGGFWASLLPLVFALWWTVHRRWMAIIGTLSGLVVIIATASSTPLGGLIAAVVGVLILPLRRRMKWVRWSIAIGIIGFQVLVGKPVWFLLTKADLVGGSTGWHRYELIEKTISNFKEWWLIGTTSTAHWGWGMWDLTNQYVVEGVRGGLLTLLLFILLIVLGFQAVGRMWRRVDHVAKYRIMGWMLGVSLFVHTTLFIGVAYFGQIIMVWYLLLAIIGSLSPMGKKALQSKRRRSGLNRYYGSVGAVASRNGRFM